MTAAFKHLDEPIPIAPTELARILALACEWTMTNSGEVYDETGGLLAGSIEEIANLAIKAGMFSRNAKGFSGIRWGEEVGGLGASSRFSTADALRSVRERPAGRRRGVGR